MNHTDTQPIVEVKNLNCRYGAFHAVSDLSFSVKPGEIYALLGTNGAGKTTTLETVEGHRTASSGTVKLFGETEVRAKTRSRTGIMLQESGFAGDLTVKESVELFGSVSGRNPNAAQNIDLAVDPAYTAVTNEEGVARFEGVEFGRWILVERQPIEGYNPSPETAGRVIVIEKDGETVSAGDPFTNTKIRADITLTKVDKAGKPLAGAKFALRDKDGKTVQEAVSAANGLVVFERVAYGTTRFGLQKCGYFL